MHQDQALRSFSLRTDSAANRRDLLIRLLALPAALGLAAQAEPESAEARKKRRKKKRRRRGRNVGGGNAGGGSGDNGGGGGSYSPDAEERACLALINDYRRDNGRAALAMHGQLGLAAVRHSRDQADRDRMTHDGSDGSDAGERIEDAGYDWRAWGENVAWNSSDGSARTAFTGWKQSAPHRANMLSANFTEIGIARARNPSSGRWYWTTTFGRR